MSEQQNNMHTLEHIKHLIPQGETTTVQFKIRSEDAYKIGVEMVAFCNTQGGMLIIGVDDKTGVISGLSFEEIRQTNTLLVNAASENVKPAIVITTETVNAEQKYPAFQTCFYSQMRIICWKHRGKYAVSW